MDEKLKAELRADMDHVIELLCSFPVQGPAMMPIGKAMDIAVKWAQACAEQKQEAANE